MDWTSSYHRHGACLSVILLGLLAGCAADRAPRPEQVCGNLNLTSTDSPRAKIPAVPRRESSTAADEKPKKAKLIRLASHQSKDSDKPRGDSNKPDSPPPLPGVPPKPEQNVTELTLDRVINTTLLADPKLRAGFQAIAAANGDAVTASLKPNPTLYVDTQLLPLTRPFTVTRQGGPPQTDVFLSFPIDWFLFGKRAAAMQAAILGVRTSEAEYAELVRQRILEAATAYYDALEAKSLVEVSRRLVANLEQLESVTKKAVEGKLKSRVDLDRVQLNLVSARQDLVKAETDAAVKRARLLQIMGQDADSPNLVISGSLDDRPSVKTLPVDVAVLTAEENRPDIQMLRWKVHAARAEAESEERKKYPSVEPQLGYTHQYQKKAIGFPDADSYLVAVTTSLPFFNRNQGNRYKAEALAVRSEFQLQEGMVGLRSEIVQATQQLQSADLNVRNFESGQLKLAKQIRETLNKLYVAGQRPLTDVLIAQEEILQNAQRYVSLRAELSRAAVKYSATLGKSLAP